VLAVPLMPVPEPLELEPEVPLEPLLVAEVPPMVSVLSVLIRFDLHAAREAANNTANNILLRGLFMISPLGCVPPLAYEDEAVDAFPLLAMY
jgi:hypothetical protein